MLALSQSTRDIIVAGGSIALADSTVANVAEFSVSNGTWTAVGAANALPGAVTAVEVNDGNVNSIFAAGRYVDDLPCPLSDCMLNWQNTETPMAPPLSSHSGMANLGMQLGLIFNNHLLYLNSSWFHYKIPILRIRWWKVIGCC